MADDRPIVKEIFIHGSPELVFGFLSEPAKMVRWIGLTAEIDPRPGGIFRVDPNGRDVIRGEVLEVVPSLRHASPAQLRRPVAMYGQPPQPAARLAALSFEHSVWTLGQLVPYLRLNGVTPPEHRMPF